jgi:hypothetical protein
VKAARTVRPGGRWKRTHSTGHLASGLPELLHSASRHGGAFILCAEVGQDRVRIEVEDAGGLWRDGPCDDGRPHGFDVVAAIAGAGNWGIDGDDRGRVAWARFGR